MTPLRPPAAIRSNAWSLHQTLFTPRKASCEALKSNSHHDLHKARALWRNAPDAIGPTAPSRLWAHLADRGADVTEFPAGAVEHRMEYVVRMNHNRNVTALDEAGV